MITITKITAVGQIREGDVLLIRRANELVAPVTVKEVLNQGSKDEEIILSKGRNIYFIMSMFLRGDSWIKECVKLDNGKMYAIGNSMHDFSTYEQKSVVRP